MEISKSETTNSTNTNTITKPTKARIEFIDLAKGVCILLVVIGHCGVRVPIFGMDMLRMPLYFILSGLFYKDYGGFLNFLVKKTNKILIPFLFFYLLAYIPYYILEYIRPGLIQTEARGLLDVFNNRQFFNGPIWFLLCLFWANLMFCFITLNVKREYLRAMSVIAVGAIGVTLGINNVFLPCMIDVAMSALPFLYFGYILRKAPILYPNKHDKYNLLFAIGLYLIAALIAIYADNPHYSFHYNRYAGNLGLLISGSICGVLAILFLCKSIKHIPVVSFCGRYSIIMLCLHHMIYRPVALGLGYININGEVNTYITAALTIAICILMIKPCVKYIPWFTAQKDLIKDKTAVR